MWRWELWSLCRWWLLFGGATATWTLIVVPFQSDRRTFISNLYARLLAFAPWLIVLEIIFLFGVWAGGSNVVPEPSTGFVVGIFEWDLWHWDCWRDPTWLKRGGLVSLGVGYLFCRTVLRWWRLPSIIFAVSLIPISIWLSIATTVGYQH